MKNDVPVKFLYRVIDERGGKGSGLPLMSVSLTRGVIPRSDISEREGRADDLSNYKVCRPGDIVVNRMSAYQGALGLSHQEGLVSPDYLVLRPNKDVSASYLTYMFKSRWFVGEMTRRLRGIGSTEQGNVRTPRINSDDLGLISIKLLTSTEQQTIADYLDIETARIDALINKKMRIMALIGDRTEILLAKYLDELIERYGEVPLKSVAKLSVSNVDKKSHEGQTPVQLCNYTDVYYQRKISKDIVFMEATADFAQIQKLTLKKNDVLITKDSETADDIAVPALVVEDLPGVVLGYHLALLRPFAVLGDFLYWVVLSRRCRDAFSLAASGVTRFGLRQDAIARVAVPAAPLDAQMTFIKLIENNVISGDRVVELIQRQVALLKEHRQALITAAVTGELEIPKVAA